MLDAHLGRVALHNLVVGGGSKCRPVDSIFGSFEQLSAIFERNRGNLLLLTTDSVHEAWGGHKAALQCAYKLSCESGRLGAGFCQKRFSAEGAPGEVRHQQRGGLLVVLVELHRRQCNRNVQRCRKRDSRRQQRQKAPSRNSRHIMPG